MIMKFQGGSIQQILYMLFKVVDYDICMYICSSRSLNESFFAEYSGLSG